MEKIILLAVLITSVLSSHYLTSQAIDTIPIHLTEANNIAVEVILNQADTLTMMFHTGASAVFITQDASQRTKRLDLNKEASINSWGGKGNIRFSPDNTISIGKQQWDSIGVSEDRHSGPGMDGKFGYNLFDDKVVELDFDRNIMVIHATLPAITSDITRLDYVYQLGSMFIRGNATIGSKDLEHQFMIHSGYSGALLFDDQFTSTHELSKYLEVISEQELKDSMGNIIKTQKAKLPQFRIGGTVFTDLTIGMFDGSLGRQKFSVLGGELLKHFNIIFDFSNQHIYLKRNGLQR